jgi:hypothetical protein
MADGSQMRSFTAAGVDPDTPIAIADRPTLTESTDHRRSRR